MPEKSVDSDYFLQLFIIKRNKRVKSSLPPSPTPLFPSFPSLQTEIVVKEELSTNFKKYRFGMGKTQTR